MKRLLDIVLSSIALVVLAPIMVTVALLVRLKLGSPVLFRQERPGMYEKPFVIYKFRSLTDRRDNRGVLLPDRLRLTPFGEFLRATSLDELPELFNVLRGEMSLVGPRPLLMSYIPYYTERERIRHSVRPGITGWAQIHGRNYLPWDDRLASDVWYVENRSMRLDIFILVRTVMAVILRKGVAPDPDAAETDLDQERSGSKRCAGCGIPFVVPEAKS